MQNFIAEIRACKNREAEEERIEVEKAKIRKCFQKGKVSSYDRRKYVTKLLYMYMLGYEIDFGHIEAITLLSSKKYVEKHMGYLACSLLLDEGHELLMLLTNQMLKDLDMKLNEDVQCLALMAIANVGGKEFTEALLSQVMAIFTAHETRPLIRKKAALCALRLFRKYPELLPPEAWTDKVLSFMSNLSDLGLLLSVTSFILGYSSKYPEPFEECVGHAIRALSRIVMDKQFRGEYVYFHICNPWLQVKLLRLLQYYPPPEDQMLLQMINKVLERIMSNTEWNPKLINKNNASHAILFEAVNLTVTYCHDDLLMEQAASIIGNFVSRELNLKYLGLEAMGRLALKGNEVIREELMQHKRVVVSALNDQDISIRRRALDVLYHMCDENSSQDIVSELLEYLKTADFAIREELVLKIAILAERFAVDFNWYVDVVLRLISNAGDFVSSDIWFRIVQIVTNSDNALKRYAASTVLEAMRSPAAHETAIKVGGYIVGEFGGLIENQASAEEQYEILSTKFATAELSSRAILLNAYAKILARNLRNGALRRKISEVFREYSDSMDSEMQQRAVEYLHLAEHGEGVFTSVFDSLPEFETESSLAQLIEERQRATEDRNIWVKAEEEFDGEEGDFVTDAPAVQENVFFDTESAAKRAREETERAGKGASSGKRGGGGGDFLDDLFGGGGGGSGSGGAGGSGSRPEAARSAFDGDEFFDGLGGDLDQAAVEFVVPPVAMAAYERLLREGDGVLYDDATIQVSYKGKFKDGRLAQFGLYFGSKARSTLEDFNSMLDDFDGLRFKESRGLDGRLEPGKQALQLYLCEFYAPFDDSPILRVSFSLDGKQRGFLLKLPIVLFKFCVPQKVEVGPFRSVFGDASYVDKKAVFKLNPVIGNSLRDAQDFCENVLNLMPLPEVDSNPNSFAAAGFIAPSKVETTFYVRVQLNPAKMLYRLVIRCADPAALDSMMEHVCSMLADEDGFDLQ